jgi:hypothetical protein
MKRDISFGAAILMVFASIVFESILILILASIPLAIFIISFFKRPYGYQERLLRDGVERLETLERLELLERTRGR